MKGNVALDLHLLEFSATGSVFTAFHPHFHSNSLNTMKFRLNSADMKVLQSNSPRLNPQTTTYQFISDKGHSNKVRLSVQSLGTFDIFRLTSTVTDTLTLESSSEAKDLPG